MLPQRLYSKETQFTRVNPNLFIIKIHVSLFQLSKYLTFLSFHCFSKQEIIREHYGIASIPTLLLLDPKTGQVFARNGVDIVKADPQGHQFPWRQFHKENLKNSGFNKINDLHKKLLATEEDSSAQVDTTDPAAPSGSEMELEKEEKEDKESKRSRATSRSSRRTSQQGRKSKSRLHI